MTSYNSNIASFCNTDILRVSHRVQFFQYVGDIKGFTADTMPPTSYTTMQNTAG